jgi:hypothetical protein
MVVRGSPYKDLAIVTQLVTQARIGATGQWTRVVGWLSG